MPECTDLERQWLDRFNEIDMDELMDELAAVFERWSKKTRATLEGPHATEVACSCAGLVHLHSCPNWVLPA